MTDFRVPDADQNDLASGGEGAVDVGSAAGAGEMEGQAFESTPKLGVLAGPDGLCTSPRRILVADDEHLVATQIVYTLGRLGYTIVGPVADGEAAIRLAAQAKPDMALLDIRMPGMDGLTVAKRLFDDLHVPVVIISAFSDPEYIDRARSAGVFGYVVKPVRHEQLLAAVAVAWDRYRDYVAQRTERNQLQQRLDDRKHVEKAKWILVSRKGISESEALQRLQHSARTSQRRLVDIAQEIIRASELV